MIAIRRHIVITAFALISATALSQKSVGINTQSPDASAALEVYSATQGMLIPRLTETARLAIVSPGEGLLVFETTSSSFWYFDGTNWQQINRNTKWALGGTSGTSDGVHFLGTTNDTPLIIKTQYEQAGHLSGLPNWNTFLGVKAGESNISGIRNSLLGARAGESLTTGSTNTLLGFRAGYNLQTGDSNILIGHQAGGFLYDETQNVMIGYDVASAANDLDSCIVIGREAGAMAQDSKKNIFIGIHAGREGSMEEAIAIGAYAMKNTFSCSRSIAIGYNAGNTFGGFDHATFIGSHAGPSSSAISYATAIGAYTKVAKSHAVSLGNDGTYALHVGIETTAPEAELHVEGSVMFGSDAPPVQFFETSGTMPAGANSSIIVEMPGDPNDYLAFTLMVEYFTGSWVPANYTLNPGYECYYRITGGDFHIHTTASNSASVIGKPYKLYAIRKFTP